MLLVTLAATGGLIAYGEFLKPWVAAFAALPADSPPPAVAPRNQPFIGIDEAVRISATVFPDSSPRWIATPEGPTGTYRVDRRQPGEANVRFPSSRVWIDPYDGRVLRIDDPFGASPASTFFNVLYPLHIGEALGLPGRWLWFCAGFVPVWLFGIGFWLSRLRRRAHRS